MPVVPKNACSHSTAISDVRRKSLPDQSPMTPSYSSKFSGKVRVQVTPLLLFLIRMTAGCKKALFFFSRVL